MVEIREVKTRKQIKEFIDFPLNLYKGNPYFVPPLYSSEKQLFKKVNPFTSSCDAIYFNCYVNNKIVGRISGIIQRDANAKWNQKKVRFTRFDAIDNQKVADALFNAVVNWAKKQGMDSIVGPLGFNDLEREGLLIEGFDKLSTFEEQYNYPYYQKLIENYGFKKDVDWIEQEIRLPKDMTEANKLERISEVMLRRYNLKFVKEKSTQVFVKKHKDAFFKLLDDTYSDLYGTCPLRPEVQKELIKGFNLLLKSDNIMGVFDKDDNMICFALHFPSIAKAVQKSKGKLTPLGIIRILHAINHPKILDLGLVGVRKDYRNAGIPAVALKRMVELLKSGECEHFETNLTLEDNEPILKLFERFDRVQHKRRRSFIKSI